MIKMTYEQVTNETFRSALRQLAQQPLPVRVAQKLRKVGQEIMDHAKRIGHEYEAQVLKKHAKLREDGSIDWNKDAEGKDDRFQFPILEGQEDAMKAANEVFGKQEVIINRNKIFITDLGNLEISAAMLQVLDPILSDFGLENDDKTSPGASPVSLVPPVSAGEEVGPTPSAPAEEEKAEGSTNPA